MRGEQLSLRRARHHWQLYAFILPCLLFVGLFMYYPVINGVFHSLYYWNGGDVERFYGLRNFYQLFTAEPPAFWLSFQNALILGLANILKMAPAILAAVCLHRVKSERLQYIYRACFVVPMVVPFAVTVLLWKAFYEPTNGVINVLLRKSGLIGLLTWTSSTAGTLNELLVTNVFEAGGISSYAVCALIGAALVFVIARMVVGRELAWTSLAGYVGGLGVLSGRVLGCVAMGGGGAPNAAAASVVGAVLGGAVLGGVAWKFANDAGRDLPRRDRLYAWAMAFVVGAFGLGLIVHVASGVTGYLTPLFPKGENPAWLGSPKLCMLALILWGFPWVGSFSVLVYLACLQQIGREIYEAAEVDGADWFHKFRHIEMPLILKQVRVMMILVIMGSINDAGQVMLLFGIEGGPGGVVQVPALFMFREAFCSQMMGYACGIGLVMFTIIVIMTKLNDWLVKPGAE
ncbi:MAG TPA: sugar ABC transporter permease [Planctomycetota bacterium]|jgi:ABC-type sugar transport system permease subunit